MSLFDADHDHHFKSAIHGGLLVLAVETCAYNTIVFHKRGGRWHFFSALVYGGLVILEVIQVGKHQRP